MDLRFEVGVALVEDVEGVGIELVEDVVAACLFLSRHYDVLHPFHRTAFAESNSAIMKALDFRNYITKRVQKLYNKLVMVVYSDTPIVVLEKPGFWY